MKSDGGCLGSDFCQELSGVEDVAFRRIYGGRPESRMISGNKRFCLVADISPLVVGHLLLLPREHHNSFASIPSGSRCELQSITPVVLDGYRRIFGECSILEHGSSPKMDDRACVTHAHWHIVPIEMTRLVQCMVEDGLLPDKKVGICDVGAAPWSKISYYMCSDGTQFYLYKAARRVQYVRSVIGRALGMQDPEWDYALFTRSHLLRRTIDETAGWHPLSD